MRSSLAGNGRHGAALAASGALAVIATMATAMLIRSGDFEGYVAMALLHGALYLAAAALVFRVSFGRRWLFAILAVAVAMRLVALLPPPNLSTDAFRYVWDGRLQSAGINPYLYVPADPRLDHLRDEAIYPHINQKERAVTIYPPAAQLLFRAAQWLGDSVLAIRIVMLALDLVTIAAAIAILHSLALPLQRVLIYAWHPLPIWEFAGHGHIDAATTAGIALGVLAVVRGRQAIGGAVLAVAVLTKYFPLLLLPALWRRWDWRMPLAAAGTAALLYLPFVGGAGTGVIGFLGQHLDNEGYVAGWGFHPVWLLRDFGLGDMSGRTYVALSLLVLGGLAVWSLFDRRTDEFRLDRVMLLGATFVFLTSPHYPWYFAFLVALLPCVPHPAAFAFTTLAPVLYLPRPPGGIGWTEIYAAVYWFPLALFIVWEIWRRWRSPPVTTSSG
ncbi:MAG: glycosyltransferase family 87 protein [Hyphomicrobiaceae bacterium]